MSRLLSLSAFPSTFYVTAAAGVLDLNLVSMSFEFSYHRSMSLQTLQTQEFHLVDQPTTLLLNHTLEQNLSLLQKTLLV